MRDQLSKTWSKAVVAIAGGSVVVVGLILVPYPGPGWLIVFAGLAILSREFTWAKRLLSWARQKYDGFQSWVLHQHWPVQVFLFLFTTFVVVITLWLLNAYGLLAGWVGLDWPWIYSPLFK